MLVSGFVLFFLALQENHTIAHYGLDVYFRSNKTIMIKTIRGSGHSPICEWETVSVFAREVDRWSRVTVRVVDSDSPWRVRWTPLTALQRAPALVSQQISRYGQQGGPPSWPEPSLAALPCPLPQGKLIFVNIFPMICLRSSFPTTTCGRVSMPFVSDQAE